jgi:hypothetical protein
VPHPVWRNSKGKQFSARRSTKWETLTGQHRPDPAEWCPRGYAIVNVDIRGTWDSEGDLYIEGSQMGTLLLHPKARIDTVIIDNCQVWTVMIRSNLLQLNHGAMVL